MSYSKIRREIAWEAARLVRNREVQNLGHARLTAAHRLFKGRVHNKHMPSDAEIRDELQRFEGRSTISPPSNPSIVAASSAADSEFAVDDERFELYRALLLPLENVHQNPAYHPEGDALYHSLQVFQLAVDSQPYDEDFLLAALLHDIGKAIDPYDHVQSGLEALSGHISDRTAWLIEHHMEAHKIHDRTIGVRALKRLSRDENFDDLVLLGQCDRAGRKRGVQTPSVDEALATIRELHSQYDGD